MKYKLLKPIVYKNPKSPLYEQVIQPDDPVAANGMDFPHLTPGELALLKKRRVLTEYVNVAEPSKK